MSVTKEPHQVTHLYVGIQKEGLVKQISVMVELGHFQAPGALRATQLYILQKEITFLLESYFPKDQISDISFNYKKTLTHFDEP